MYGQQPGYPAVQGMVSNAGPPYQTPPQVCNSSQCLLMVPKLISDTSNMHRSPYSNDTPRLEAQ